MNRIVRWDRDFQVWYYTVSYHQLLLRSSKTGATGTRIDILFSNVYSMLLRPSYANLRIDVADGNWPYGSVEPPSGTRANWYILNDDEGHVLATHCQWHEDDGDNHSPSRFGPLRGVE